MPVQVQWMWSRGGQLSTKMTRKLAGNNPLNWSQRQSVVATIAELQTLAILHPDECSKSVILQVKGYQQEDETLKFGIVAEALWYLESLGEPAKFGQVGTSRFGRLYRQVSEISRIVDCFYGKTVVITSHRGANLQNHAGSLCTDTEVGNGQSVKKWTAGWEHWTISEADNGKLRIKSHRGGYLHEDMFHRVNLSRCTGPSVPSTSRELWTICALDSPEQGSCNVVIKSCSGYNLQDDNGCVKLVETFYGLAAMDHP